MAKFTRHWADEEDTDKLFELVNEDVVERLQKQGKVTLPKKKIKVPKDKQWNTKKLNSKLLQTILNGDSLDKFEKDLVSIIGDNDASLQRNARTMVTGAECGGRIDSYKELESRGVVLKKVWMATPDDRTRKSHFDMDGEERNIDDEFSNGCQYPADPECDEPSEVWNCRCTMTTHIIGFMRRDGSVSYVNEVDSKQKLHDKQMNEERERREEEE